MAATSIKCSVCNDTGKVRYDIPGDSEPRPFGNGILVQAMTGSGTRACECVRNEPAIYDRATWWELESVYSAEVQVPVGDETISISVEREVPRNEKGRRCHRTAENFHYPTMIDLEASYERVTLFADQARELAAALLAAAEACDKADEIVEPAKET